MDDPPVTVVAGTWCAIPLILFGAVVVGPAIGVATALGWLLWRWPAVAAWPGHHLGSAGEPDGVRTAPHRADDRNAAASADLGGGADPPGRAAWCRSRRPAGPRASANRREHPGRAAVATGIVNRAVLLDSLMRCIPLMSSSVAPARLQPKADVTVVRGRSSYAMTADIYGHVGPAQQREAADRLDQALRW